MLRETQGVVATAAVIGLPFGPRTMQIGRKVKVVAVACGSGHTLMLSETHTVSSFGQ